MPQASIAMPLSSYLRKSSFDSHTGLSGLATDHANCWSLERWGRQNEEPHARP